MKFRLNTLSLAIVASATLLSTNAFAEGHQTHVQCGSGGPVRNSLGECVLAAGGASVEGCGEVKMMNVSFGADAFFDFNESTLKPAGREKLNQLANDIAPLNVQSVEVVGHTDSIGSESYNQRLSEARARSAANHLVTRGVSAGVISARGMGELQPIAPNRNADGSDNPAGRAQNRRVDVNVVAEKAQ